MPDRQPRRDPGALAGSVGALAIAAFAVAQSLRLRIWSGGEPGEGLFPLLAAAVLGILAIASLFERVRRPPGGEAAAPASSPVVRAKVLAYAVALILYGVIFVHAGHAAATIVVFVPLFRLVERLSWVRALAIAVGSAAVTYLVFERLLRVPLPAGLL